MNRGRRAPGRRSIFDDGQAICIYDRAATITTSAVHPVLLPQGALMQRDPELSAILDQAAHNLDSLELLVRTASEDDLSAIAPLRQRLEALQTAYRNETNALTRQVIKRAIDRRTTGRRRRGEVGTA